MSWWLFLIPAFGLALWLFDVAKAVNSLLRGGDPVEKK